jgi:hypothetical protein
MIGKIVDQVIGQVNQHPRADSIKRLLLMRLEMEMGGRRGTIGEIDKTPIPDVYDLTGGFNDANL